MNNIQIQLLNNTVQIFLDFEASGLHPESYPIEIGIAYEGKTYSRLIKPVYYWDYWDYNAQDIHNIEREEITQNGIDVAVIAQELNSLFAGKTLWADANADKFWMDTLFEAAKLEREFYVSNIKNILPEEYHEQFAKETIGMTEHRALADALELKRSWGNFLLKQESC